MEAICILLLYSPPGIVTGITDYDNFRTAVREFVSRVRDAMHLMASETNLSKKLQQEISQFGYSEYYPTSIFPYATVLLGDDLLPPTQPGLGAAASGGAADASLDVVPTPRPSR